MLLAALTQLNTLDSPTNPITNCDAFSRTAHVHSCSTGHQQRGADRGFWASARSAGVSTEGVSEGATYWSVRTAKVEAQSREKVCMASPSSSSLFSVHSSHLHPPTFPAWPPFDGIAHDRPTTSSQAAPSRSMGIPGPSPTFNSRTSSPPTAAASHLTCMAGVRMLSRSDWRVGKHRRSSTDRAGAARPVVPRL